MQGAAGANQSLRRLAVWGNEFRRASISAFAEQQRSRFGPALDVLIDADQNVAREADPVAP